MEAAENKRKKWNWRGHQNEEERMEIEDKWAGSKLLVKGPKNAGEEAMYTTNRSKPSKLETPKLNTQGPPLVSLNESPKAHQTQGPSLVSLKESLKAH